MLIGQYISKLTENKRLAVPKKFRDELGEQMILTKWYEGCLVLVSKHYWQDLIKRLIGKSQIVISPIRDIDRFILASAYEVNLDSQGRFVVPESLIHYAKLEDDVVFIGLNDRVEIWSLSIWQKMEEISEEKAYSAIEKIAKKEKIND
ncbi:division/cell wall cluster transcriptional repressor MraZ [Candidatus Woesebacteria bacterium RIFCSPLOWO2_01_FULL_37_19]|uniref:Transcriptional regulator MraZ n=1 Tax=Candidatus Woesebacteria bacterium RIFCSPLOWO2_01_FULL_37_19 TaxID=1802514 RepID=A0A1F8B6T0_9BACT|nr:MAG: division/cell wall cluster transcriptional repressor MraZ [Candidatus Woesebacteria bacterium RIFCSPLOWO2_01_FULL_37_19]